MKAIGYADCAVCGYQHLQGYAPRGYQPGDALCVWSHVDDKSVLGWGRQPKCPGSYKPGLNTRLSSELREGREAVDA